VSTRSEQLGTAPSNSVIVVGVDGSPSSAAALRWASHQARATGACLRVVTSWGYPRAYGYDVAYMDDWHPEQAARDAQGEALSDAAEDLDGVTVQTTVAEGEPARVLLDAAKEADLLVVGSRGHGELAGMLLGSVSEYCAAHAECPVVVVRPHHTSRR
jgi:nucleotide-binding universal stress UspA family protein